LNNNWYFDEKGGWYSISTINFKEELLFSNIIKQNEIPLKFHKLNLKWIKKNSKKFQNKLIFDFSQSDLCENDISTLAESLPLFPNIKVLNISFCPKIPSNGYLNLVEAIKKLTNLTEINLSSNNINDEALKNICNYFDKNSKLNTINLSWNNISSTGFSFLCKSISNNKLFIKDLDLCGNKITDEGFKAFAEEVKSGNFDFLYKINFSYNSLEDETMNIFLTIFSSFPNLYEINLSNNNITHNSVINFAPVINDLIDNITIIDISNNKLSDALKYYFGQIGTPLNVRY
jgi:Ran GTPase-activating protein (RanGAP) involved in mRNA processing and transport